MQANLPTEDLTRVNTDSRFREAKEEARVSSHFPFRVGETSACRLWIKESRLCRSRIRWVSKTWPLVQGRSEATENTGSGIVPGTGPEARGIEVGGECGAVNGTEPGPLALDVGADSGFSTW
jgi:hypothetical protein